MDIQERLEEEMIQLRDSIEKLTISVENLTESINKPPETVIELVPMSNTEH